MMKIGFYMAKIFLRAPIEWLNYAHQFWGVNEGQMGHPVWKFVVFGKNAGFEVLLASFQIFPL